MEATFKQPYSSKRVEVCGTCKGEGKLYKETVRLHNYDDGHFETCWMCKGYGVVEVVREGSVIITPKTPQSCSES